MNLARSAITLVLSTSHAKFSDFAQPNISKDSVLKPIYKNEPISRLVSAKNNLIVLKADPALVQQH